MMNRKSGPNCNHNFWYYTKRKWNSWRNGSRHRRWCVCSCFKDYRSTIPIIHNNALWLQMSTIFVGKQMSMSWLHAGQMGRFRYKIFFFPRSHNFGAQPRFLIDIENFRGVEQFSIISFYYKSKGHLTDPNKCYLIGR